VTAESEPRLPIDRLLDLSVEDLCPHSSQDSVPPMTK
jgi:hypothetical protein